MFPGELSVVGVDILMQDYNSQTLSVIVTS